MLRNKVCAVVSHKAAIKQKKRKRKKSGTYKNEQNGLIYLKSDALWSKAIIKM